jgi:hypothetical protein
MAVDFAFVPLTAAEKKQTAQEMCDRVMGPVLEQLGLLTEEDMEKRYKGATKADLVAALQRAWVDMARLRERVADLEHRAVPSLAEQDEKAVRHLAGRVAEHLATDGDVVDSIQEQEHRERAVNVLREMLRCHAVVVLTVGDEDCASTSMSNRLKDSLWPMVRLVDEAQRKLSEEAVRYIGVQAIVAQLVQAQRDKEEA